MLFIQITNAQRVKSIKGEYTYHVPENVTLDIAKQTALQRAKIQALADEFGTIVMQNCHASKTITVNQMWIFGC